MMKLRLAPLMYLAVASAWSWSGVYGCAVAAPGTVVVVSEGLSPQVLDLGTGYLRRADEDPELVSSFAQLQENAKPATVEPDALQQMKGLLQSAHDSGYATGLVTSGDVTKVAPLFYNLADDVPAALSEAGAPYDFLAGGGSANFKGAETRAKFAESQNTFVGSATDLSGELQGKVLATVAPGDLNYSLDRDPAQESSLSELTTTALDMLVSGQKPFLLVVHDNLLGKAIQARDTPALFEQFRELNTIMGDVLARRVDEPSIKVAALMTGSPTVPKFSAISPEEQNNIYFWIAGLQKSFAGAGRELKGKSVEEITAFADADTGEYKGWDVSAADKTKIAAGELDPEKAIRASYEPVLKLRYAATPSQPTGFVLGLDAPVGLVAALKALAATPAK